MRTKYLRHLPWILSTLSLVAAWVALIWTALEVSSIVLANLHQIFLWDLSVTKAENLADRHEIQVNEVLHDDSDG